MKRFKRSPLFWPTMGLCAVLLFDLIFLPGFFTIQLKNGYLYGRVIDIINNAATLMILSIGMTLVIATGGTDISVGSILAISGAIVAQMLGPGQTARTPLAVCLLVALAVSAVLGCWNGMLVAVVGVSPMVATLILNVAGRGIAQLITGGQIPTVIYKPFCMIASYVPGMPLPFSVLIVILMFVLAELYTRKTSFGMFVESVGTNATASRYSGINAVMIVFLTYVISGLCAGVGGFITTSIIKAADANNAGYLIEMDAILSVALGGTKMTGGRFSLGASIIGALIIQSLTTTLYAWGVPPQVLPVVKAVVVILICLIQSEEFRGLLGRIGNGERKRAHA
ncbi:MAG TPA: sugar ABC transporter permease [Ruminococcaceae bacterium]|nr:sugar ABC transporter permease [Oscillospiraceae bacterium]